MLLGTFRKEDRRINLLALAFRGSLVFALLQFDCASLWARPTTALQAKRVVAGWLTTEMQPLGTALGQKIIKVETFSNANEEPIYYVVYLQPSGFVVVPTDDLVEPIIAFADDGTFDPSPDNPLGALVDQDLNGRVEAARQSLQTQNMVMYESAHPAQSKWSHLENLSGQPEQGLIVMGLGSVSDIRVEPLIQSKWGQAKVCGNNCYNYYTPEHYPSGCFATAIAQMLKYYEYPNFGIGEHTLLVYVDDVPRWLDTRGGDGNGGPYNWSLMDLDPDCSTDQAQMEAIGALCYDVGLLSLTHYSQSGSGVHFEQKEAIAENFTTILYFSSSMYGCNGCRQGLFYNIGAGLIGMINPNLDAGSPVLLTIHHTQVGLGHAILCDGYGYDYSTLYHHLNMGWNGSNNAWYNLPTINSSPSYNTINGCIYNLYTSGSGEVISGRVTDTSGNAIGGATVVAQKVGGDTYNATTNIRGIYALVKVPPASTYTVSVTKTGYDFTNQNVTTGTSIDMEKTSGNRWGIDFVGDAATHHLADTDSDYVISMLEILGYIDEWAVGDVSMLEVLEGIDLWAAGHYYWDESEQKFKPGEQP